MALTHSRPGTMLELLRDMFDLKGKIVGIEVRSAYEEVDRITIERLVTRDMIEHASRVVSEGRLKIDESGRICLEESPGNGDEHGNANS